MMEADRRNLSRLLEVFDRVIKVFSCLTSCEPDIELSKSELLAMVSIFRQGEINMGRLAEDLGISFGASTKIIDRLIEKQLVFRERNRRDRRVVKVGLTARGEEIVQEYQKHKIEAFEKLLALLTPDEQENFISILEKVAQQANSET